MGWDAMRCDVAISHVVVPLEPSWTSRLALRRVRDHFIFSVETTGAYTPAQVVREAITVLKTKTRVVKQELKKTMPGAM